MRKSDGMGKVCNCKAETLRHLFLKCNKLGNLWNVVEHMLRLVLQLDILIDYIIIYGEEKIMM